jgi:GT2 family glycosyltransferase
MKSLYVIIPNWNGLDLIRECLDSLRTQTVAHKVIVVDNGSVDGSNDVIRDNYSEVQLLEFPNNAGFAGGVNRGIRPALQQGADYVILLNNDAVADAHWLEELVRVGEGHPEAGMVAAKIVTQDGKRIDSTGDFYSVWGFPFPRGRGEEDKGQYDGQDAQTIFAASGGASLYRGDTLREIGLFDERFFAYFEDVDIGFRARLAGWSVIYAPKAIVRHSIGGTSSRIDDYGKTPRGGAKPMAAPVPSDGHGRPSAFARYHTVKNFHYVYLKNMPGWLYWKYLPKFWASLGMMFVSDLKRGLLVSNLKATATAMKNLPGMLASRWGIQRRRKVAPATIDEVLIHELPPLQRLRFVRLGLARGKK